MKKSKKLIKFHNELGDLVFDSYGKIPTIEILAELELMKTTLQYQMITGAFTNLQENVDSKQKYLNYFG